MVKNKLIGDDDMIHMENIPILIMLRLFEIFAHIFLLNSIINKKIKKKEYIISTIIVVALYELITLVIPEKYKLIIVFVTLTITVSLVSKINIYQVVIGYGITQGIILIIDIINVVILFDVLDAKKFQDIVNSEKYYNTAIIVLSSLMIIVGQAIKYLKLTFTNVEITKKNIGIAFNSLLTLLFVLPSASIIASYIENKPLSIQAIIASISSMLAMLVLSIFNSQKRYNLVISEKNLEYEKNHNLILQSLVDGLRTFKHDYNNTLSTLYGYVQLGDMKSLKRMFKEILEESRQISTLDKLNPNIIKDPNIFGILIAKYQDCIKKNITMNLEIFTELENIEIKTYDLTRILGIFLDNAIEASAGSEDKRINLLITEEKGKIIIEITNTYTDKGLTVEKMYEKGISSKGECRGLGLYKAKEIIKKNPGVELKTTKDKEIFMQKLIIQKYLSSVVK